MNVENLAKGLTYKGEAEGKRRTYYVFEGTDFYLIMSFKAPERAAGNFDVVGREQVDYVLKHFAGKPGVTAQAVFDQAHTIRHFSSRFDALRILYILVALGQARVDRRFTEQKSLVFNIK